MLILAAVLHHRGLLELEVRCMKKSAGKRAFFRAPFPRPLEQ